MIVTRKKTSFYCGMLLMMFTFCWAFFSLFNTTITQAADTFYTVQVIIVFTIPFVFGAFLLRGKKHA